MDFLVLLVLKKTWIVVYLISCFSLSVFCSSFSGFGVVQERRAFRHPKKVKEKREKGISVISYGDSEFHISTSQMSCA